MPRSALTALAVLKVHWDERQHDYIENFVPFVVDCIRDQSQDVVSLPDLQKAVREKFGLQIPLNPLRQILTRARKRKFVRQEAGVYYRNSRKCDEAPFREVRASVESQCQDFISRLQTFAIERFGENWTADQTESNLEAFLREEDVEVLFSIVEHGSASEPASRYYVLGSFINEIVKHEPPLMNSLETMAIGSVLSCALYLPDPGKISQRFTDTRVYLDTTLLVYAVGYAGPDRAAPVLEMIRLLRLNGASLYCFIESENEVLGILDACAHRLRTGDTKTAYGPSMEYFIEAGKTASDVEVMAARLRTKLSVLSVSVDERPPVRPKYQVDESGFQDRLRDAINYQNENALVHDVQCVCAIAQIRSGRESYMLENSRGIFITTNSALVRTAKEFFQAGSTPRAVPLCVTDHAIANLLWLKSPTKAPDLPLLKVFSDAYAATQPSESLWKRYLTEIAGLERDGKVSADDYYILRYSTVAKNALAEVTRGDESGFSEGTPLEVLEIAKQNLREGLSAELDLTKANLARANERLVEICNDNRTRISNLENAVGRVVFWFTKALFVATSLGMLLAIGYAFPWGFPAPQVGWPRYGLAFLLLVLMAFTIANLTYGTTLRELADRVERSLCDWLSSKLMKHLGLSISSGDQSAED